MGFVGGPIGGLLVAAVLLLAVLLWLRRDRRHPGPRLHGDAIDREELEEAEREVRDLPMAPPGEAPPDDDWGPGTPRRTPLVPRGPAA